MQIRMEYPDRWDTEQMRKFLEGSTELELQGQGQHEVYGWIQATLVHHEYARRSRGDKGLIRAFLSKVTGRSVPQITRLIRQFGASGEILSRPVVRRRFPRKYTPEDVTLLAQVDQVHQRLSGPATRHILQREWQQFGKPEFQRLAHLSVSHLYNLRASSAYRRQAAQFGTTQPVQIPIGERRRPEPGDRPGFLRVDTVHQGDWEGVKGVYHINAVDAVTQWEIVGCTAKISEAYLLPVLEAMLHQFPFRILGFHSDNGSEYVNKHVVRLLNKLWVEFTKSRPNKSSDNALVEGKNGAIIRKHIGWGHIASEHAERVRKFYTAHFNPYLNYHRPCGFATLTVDARGKRKRIYKARDYATPYEKFKSLPNAETYLKPGLTFAQLDGLALALSDTECARKMHRAKVALLHTVKLESPFPPRF
jgi:transposase InsO family protein